MLIVVVMAPWITDAVPEVYVVTGMVVGGVGVEVVLVVVGATGVVLVVRVDGVAGGGVLIVVVMAPCSWVTDAVV